MKKLKGSFTVEAVFIMPFLIIISIVFIYLLIYIYDRTLIMQDVNSLAAKIKSSKDTDNTLEICKKEYEVISKEHPYLALDEITLSVDAGLKESVITLSGEWKVPIYSGFSQNITYQKTASHSAPVAIMLKTQGIKKAWEEKQDE